MTATITIKKWTLFTVALLFVASFAAAFICLLHSTEPIYQGRSLTYWIEQYRNTRGSESSREAADAVRNIGTNALPTLLTMLKTKDSAFRTALINWSAKQSFVNFDLKEASVPRFQAQLGYEILGPIAQSQIPQLIQILTNNNSAAIHQCAASALGWIGPDAKSATSALLITAKDLDDNIRNNSLWALSRIQPDVDLVLPLLIASLDDSFHVARENAAIALGKYGSLATAAVPTLVRTRNVNNAGLMALRQIDPKTASTLEVK
jgi:HEAT repeat protein